MGRPIPLLIFAFTAFLSQAQASVPSTLNYQGRLRLSSAGNPPAPDSSGNTVQFSIFDAATGGSQLWSETWGTASSCVTTTAGLFNVVLGSFNPLSIPFDQPYWLEISWHNGVSLETMSPRQPLTSAPYAFRAKFADTSLVPVPLSLTANSPAQAVITGTNLAASGAVHGLEGLANASSNGIGVRGQGGQFGVFGLGVQAGVLGSANSAFGGGVAGSTNINNNSGIGASGQNSGPNNTGYGVFGLNNGASNTGAGVYGQNNSLGGTGIRAEHTLPGGMALRVQGNALFNPGSVTFSSHVDFSGATITGLSLPGGFVQKSGDLMSGALTISAAAGSASAALGVINTGAGYGVLAYNSVPGAIISIDANHKLGAAVYGISPVSASAGVIGMNTNVVSKDAAGMVAIGHYSGIYGTAYGATSTATGGTFEAQYGTGVTARGVTAVAARSESALGVAIEANAYDGQSRALSAYGTSMLGGYVTMTAGAVSFGSIEMSNALITGLANPIQPQDAANKDYVDTQVGGGNFVLKSGDTMLGGLDMNGFSLSGLPMPGSGDQAANRNYVDSNFLFLGGGALTGTLDMQNNRIFNLANPSLAGDAANKNYVDANFLGFSGGSLFGNIDMGGNMITSLAGPSVGSDAVNKNYVDLGFLALGGGSLTGDLDMQFNRIHNLAAPSVGSDAATKSYVDGGFLPLNGGQLFGQLDMQNNVITNLAAPATPGDAANRAYVDNQANYFVQKTGDGMTGVLDMGSQQIQSLAAPSMGTDAANKNYVDSQVGNYVLKSGDTMTGTLDLPGGGLRVGGNQVFVSPSGNVGLGTTSPMDKLEVSFLGNGGVIVDSTSGNAPEVGLYQAGGIKSRFFANSTVSYLQTADASNLELGTNNTSRLFIAPAGDVGLGAFPATNGKLQVFAGTGLGVSATTNSSTAALPAIFGINTATTGGAYGVRGTSYSNQAAGVYGTNLNAGGGGIGVLGVLGSGNGIGVLGTTEATFPVIALPIGAYAYSQKASGVGLYAKSTNLSNSYAVVAEGGSFGLSATALSGGTAVYARANAGCCIGAAVNAINDGAGDGLSASSAGASGVGVRGQGGSGASTGVYGTNASLTGFGVQGINTNNIGVLGTGSKAVVATGTAFGLSATASSPSGTAVLAGASTTTQAVGINNNGSGNGLYVTSVGSGEVGAAIRAWNNGTQSNAYAIYGRVPNGIGNPAQGAAVYGSWESGNVGTTGVGVEGLVNSGSGAGVYGHAITSASHGVFAENPGAGSNLAGGGSALRVKGRIRVEAYDGGIPVTNDGVAAQQFVNVTIPRSNGRVNITATKSAASNVYTIQGLTNLVDVNSVVLISISGMGGTTLGSTVEPQAGAFVIHFSAAIVLQNGWSINYVIINQQ